MTPAREWWEAVRRSARAIEPTLRELDALADADEECLSWYSAGGGGAAVRSGVSDPTADMALRRSADLDRLIAETQARLDEMEEQVGDALRLLRSVEDAVSARASLALELYYVDLADTWSDVADDIGVSRETLRADRDAALDWCDEHADLLR